ncbi:MAG: extracellular solute-binding protein [Candidatus Velthaea sp.]
MKRKLFLAATAVAGLPRIARAASGDVSVAYAGSLVTLMEKSIGAAFAATGYAYKGEGKGSSTLAALIRDGLRTPDVFISADTAAIESLRGSAGHDAARWYATFASTRMQIAYSPKSRFAADFGAAAAGKLAWYDLLRRPGIKVARTDPAQDPKGYRTLLVMELAQAHYKIAGLARAVLGEPRDPEQIIPEEDALVRLETGDIDAMWAYATESASRRLPAVPLPPEIDLGEPRFSADYARAAVTVEGKAYRGAPIVYALTIPTNAMNPGGGAAFVRFLLGAQGKTLLKRGGLTIVPPAIGGARDAVPRDLLPVLRAAA